MNETRDGEQMDEVVNALPSAMLPLAAGGRSPSALIRGVSSVDGKP